MRAWCAHSNQADTLVYAIGLFTEEEKHEATKARRALKELTAATGGLAFYPKDVNEVQALAVEVARDIRRQYTIYYTPAIQALDGSYRQIKVTVDAPGKPAVRTRSGYYATPDSVTRSASGNPSASASLASGAALMLRFLWIAIARLSLCEPWDSPYLRWRIETYSGIPADSLDRKSFFRFLWTERPSLWAYLSWAARLSR